MRIEFIHVPLPARLHTNEKISTTILVLSRQTIMGSSSLSMKNIEVKIGDLMPHFFPKGLAQDLGRFFAPCTSSAAYSLGFR
jgi:hypothetical protein